MFPSKLGSETVENMNRVGSNSSETAERKENRNVKTGC